MLVRNNIPTPNPFLNKFLLSPEWVRVGREAAGLAAGLFSATVARQSGALAASPVVESHLGGEKSDRIVFDVISGRGLPRGGYGAAHEFGTKRVVEGPARPGEEDEPVTAGGFSAADDWVRVLAILDSLP